LCLATYSSLDFDPESIGRAKGFIDKSLQKNWLVFKANFTQAKDIFIQNKLFLPTAILMDLGTSQYQLADLKRGFSFESENLDMRMNPDLSVTASDLVNCLSKKELIRLFTELSDLSEFKASRIALAIVKTRQIKPLASGRSLAELIKKLYPVRSRIHPATTVFQALRMAVNSERENIRLGIANIFDLLLPKGRLGVISFHSGEDRLIKRFFINLKNQKKAVLLHKLLKPTSLQLQINPKIRSAKFRSIQKN